MHKSGSTSVMFLFCPNFIVYICLHNYYPQHSGNSLCKPSATIGLPFFHWPALILISATFVVFIVSRTADSNSYSF